MILRTLVLTIFTLPPLVGGTHADDGRLAGLEQRAFASAVAAVEDSVVQIRTIGGLDRVGKNLLSQGPTTGLIISPDGYIVSSAFNFASQPSSILVRLANGQQHAAELIGRDKNRMLVLLKINAGSSLPIPEAAKRERIQVGQWAIALGRTFQSKAVDISIGIVSATNRMYGRVIQTDANVSVANYGGPLVDISGRVLGVLVPMSPQAPAGDNAELAGAEFYDSGIGFAVPLEHILKNLERWKEEAELLPGKLGVGLESGDAHVTPPRITSVWPGSPAAKAKWQAKDLIMAVEGTSVSTQAQLRFQILPRYADDTLRVTLDRAGDTLETEITLAGELPPFRHAFLGIIPASPREKDEEEKKEDDATKGVVAQVVWPDSPADVAGLQSGDRITKLDETTINQRTDLQAALTASHPGKLAKLTVVRGEEELDLSALLGTLPENVLLPTDLESLSGGEVANSDPLKTKKLLVPEFSQEAVYLVPNVEQSRSPGLLLLLGDGNEESNQRLFDDWHDVCHRSGMILMIAPPQKDSPWLSDDLGYLQQLVRLAGRQLRIDTARTFVVGQGKAGQLAFALTLAKPSSFGGVVSIDAPLPRTLKIPNTSSSNRLAVLSIESKGSNFAPLIRRDTQRLRETGYPTTLLPMPTVEAPNDPLDSTTRSSIERWIVGLDRL